MSTRSGRDMQEQAADHVFLLLNRADDQYTETEIERRYPLPDRITFYYHGYTYIITVEFEDPR